MMEADPFLYGQLLIPNYTQGNSFEVPVPAQPMLPMSGYDDKLINAYYVKFHGAHPILPPWGLLQSTQPPQYLTTTMEFIGSHYIPNMFRTQLRAKLTTDLHQAYEKTPALVQARLLSAIALHARNEQKEALSIFHTAIDLALDLNLHDESYILATGSQNSVLEESLRRTWWELYVVDGILAGLHHKGSFRTASITATTRLPCEEAVFLTGAQIPLPPTLTQFQNRFFQPETPYFSSYCYRIEAIRLLSRVLAVSTSSNDEKEGAEAAGYALSSWAHHLPPGKTEVLDPHGEGDEMLFQAHMLVNCAIVYLNLPRSNLAAARPARADVECARRRFLAAPTASQHVHAVNAVKAAKELSNLSSLPMAIERHTPFFICSCVLSAITQLSGCSIDACKCLEPHRQQVIQSIGMLKTLGNVWPVAFHVLGQVRDVTREVMEGEGFRPDPGEGYGADTGQGFRPGTGQEGGGGEGKEQVGGIDGDRFVQEATFGWAAGSAEFDLGQHTFSEG